MWHVSLDTHACKESKWNLVLIEETQMILIKKYMQKSEHLRAPP